MARFGLDEPRVQATNRHPRTIRLGVERLEERCVLSRFTVAPTGNDTALGTDAAPWKTLQRAANVVGPGDIVTVRAGTYTGFVMGWDDPQGGTAEAPIVFRADPNVVIATRNNKTPDGINLEGVSFVVIQGFTIDNTAGTITRAGIRSVQNQHVTIRDNRIDRPGKWGIFTSFSDDVVIEGNVASRAQQQHGIYVSNSGDRPVLVHNVLWGNAQAGIHLNGDVRQGGDGIISDALVEGNTIFDNGRNGASGINADGVQDSRFQNNLLFNNHASGISLYRDDGGGPSTGNIVVNNTVLVAPDGRWALNIQNGSTGNRVFANILYNQGSYRGSLSLSTDSLPEFVSDSNVVMSLFTTDAGDSRMSLERWQATTGQDRHSFVATPDQLFVDPTNQDYHLRPGSLAIDVGTIPLAPAHDLDGQARPQGKGDDAGSDEFPMASTSLDRLIANRQNVLQVNDETGRPVPIPGRILGGTKSRRWNRL